MKSNVELRTHWNNIHERRSTLETEVEPGNVSQAILVLSQTIKRGSRPGASFFGRAHPGSWSSEADFGPTPIKRRE